MNFVNTMPYISNPIGEFSDFKFVSWEKEIYPKFKGEAKKQEIDFFADLITEHNLKNVIDLGVGGGTELSGIIKTLQERNYPFESIEANEVDEDFIMQAQALFYKNKQNVLIHKANWLDLPKATPTYEHLFDFGYLTGNSLTSIGGGTREYTKKAQQNIVSKFARLIKEGAYLFIDTRNYDYIKSLMSLPEEQIIGNFHFENTVYYHGLQEKVVVFPAYISDTVVVLHYYDKENKAWSKIDLYPIYHNDMVDILATDFEIQEVYYDFDKTPNQKSLFIQYLVKKK